MMNVVYHICIIEERTSLLYLHRGVSSLDVTGCIKIITDCIAAWLGFSILLPTPPPQFLLFLSQVSCISPISPISAHFRREHFIVIFTSGCLKSCCSRLHYFITYCKRHGLASQTSPNSSSPISLISLPSILYLPKPPTYFPSYSSPAAATAAAVTRIPMVN